jgi:hypothetical protein
VDAPILASTLFGAPVTVDGECERLVDLGVVKAGTSWRISSVRTRRRDAAFTGWSAGHLSAAGEIAHGEATWLREALFDRQIVDLEGRRVIRIGDVVLRADGNQLDVVAVEVGAAAVLRRLHFARLAARLQPQLLAIDRLHLPSAAAGALLLDGPRERFEQLDSGTVANLLSRLPLPVAENAVRGSRHRAAVTHDGRIRRRRHRYPRARR